MEMNKERDFYNVSLKVFLRNEKGEILGLEAARGGTYDGFYDLPGGRSDLQIRRNSNKRGAPGSEMD